MAVKQKLDNPNGAPPPPPSSTSTAQPTATVQVIHAVKFKPAMRELLEQVPSFMKFSTLVKGKTPANTFTPLEVISYYANTLLELGNGHAPYVMAGVREYINSRDLTVVVRGNEIVKNTVKNSALLPPAVTALLSKASGNKFGNNQSSQPEAYTGPKTVVAGGQNGKGAQNGKNAQSAPERDGSDDDSSDDDDLLRAGGNRSRSHQEIKQEQAKLKKQEQQIKQQQNRDAQAKKGGANGAKGGNANANNANNGRTVVHLIRDPILYKALDIPSERWITMDEVEQMINKQLVPTKSLCTTDLFALHQLFVNRDLVEYLFDIHLHPDREATYHANQLGNATAGLRQIQQARFGQVAQNGIDIPRLFTLGTSKLSFKQTDSNATLGAPGAKVIGNASAAQPAILLFSKNHRNKDLTLAVGFELFGINPKDFVKAEGFRTLMAAAVKLIDTKEDSDVRRLFPRSINERCHSMLKLQGNQVQKMTSYCVDTLKIHPSNIFDLTVKGKKK
jgi:hypothetical protein